MANDWNLTRANIIKSALRYIGVLPTGEDTSADFIVNQTAEANDALHALLMDLQNRYATPFKISEEQYPLNKGADVIAVSGTNYTCRRNHTSVNASTWVLSTAYSIDDKVYPSTKAGFYFKVTVAGTSNGSEPTFPTRQGETVTDNTVTWEAVADNEPAVGADWESYWEQTGSSGSVWAINTDYFSSGQFDVSTEIVDVLSGSVRLNGIDHPLTAVTRDQFFSITNQESTGFPTFLYFEKHVTPRVHLWPQSSDTNHIVHLHTIRIFNDIDLGADTLTSTNNLTLRWLRYIIYALAVDLGEQYQIKSSKLQRLERKAVEMLKFAVMRDRESTSSSFIEPAY